MGEPDTAEEQLRAIMSRNQNGRDPTLLPIVSVTILGALVDQGKLDEAYSRATSLLAGDESVIGWDTKCSAVRVMGQVCLERADWEQAHEYLSEALSQSEKLGSGEGQGFALCGLAHSHYALGAYSDAQECLSRAIPLFRELRPQFVGGALALLALVEARLGEGASAIQNARRALGMLRELDWPGELLLGLIRVAQVFVHQGVEKEAGQLNAEIHGMREAARFVSATVVREHLRLERALGA